MAKRFSVATDPLDLEQTKAFKDALKGKAWWHWLPNYWLIKDPTDSLSPSDITSLLKIINPKGRAVVLEIEKSTWSALTRPDAKGRDMAAWIKGTWSLD